MTSLYYACFFTHNRKIKVELNEELLNIVLFSFELLQSQRICLIDLSDYVFYTFMCSTKFFETETLDDHIY